MHQLLSKNTATSTTVVVLLLLLASTTTTTSLPKMTKISLDNPKITSSAPSPSPALRGRANRGLSLKTHVHLHNNLGGIEITKMPLNNPKITFPTLSPTPTGRANRSLLPKTHVYLHNNIGGGQEASVHPHSKVLDFGPHMLLDGQTVSLEFYPGIIPYLTDVTCDFSWAHGTLTADVYWYSRDHSRCFKHCHWNITKDGVLGINSKGQADVVHWWHG